MSLDELNVELLSCRRCPRLVEWRERVAREKRRAYRDWDYWGKPVPGFGDSRARVFVVGLAPGAHGSNRTGRQFTGDASGDFLYPALYRAGFASQPNSVSREDGLILTNLYTSPVCRCAPPDNKPTPQAINGILGNFSVKEHSMSFDHTAIYQVPSASWLVCSYHPSRQNTQTGRLTVEMFDQVWKTVRGLLER
ncbi:MAG: uracil-DNA glycosylase [Chloroflexi bacterium]|nr:uracil-DNA glycosylase [Chloroflexota bacterium]